MWEFFIARTRTGEVVQRVQPTSIPGSWSRRLNHGGGGSDDFVVIPAEDGEPANPNEGLWSTLTAPPASLMLVVQWGGRPFYLGLIWGTSYSPRVGVVTVQHRDIWSLWARRMAVPQAIAWNDEDPRAEYFKEISVRVQGTSTATMMKRVVTWGQSGPSELSTYLYELPIVLPDDTPGDSEPLYANGYDFPTVAQTLGVLMDRDDGPAVDFRPEIIQGPLYRWRMVTLSEPEGALYLHVNAPEGPVQDVRVTRDGEDFVTDFYASGAGSGRDIAGARRFMNSPGLTDVGMTAHERYSEISRYDELDTVAIGEFQRRRRVTEQWEVDIDLGEPGPAHVQGEPGSFEVQDLYPGRAVFLRSYWDPVLPAMGPRRFMLVGLRPAGERLMTLELQPAPEES